MNEIPWNHDEGRTVRLGPARLIVWECDGSWARHLRSRLAPGGPRVYETRTAQACRELVGESPASIVVALWTTSTSDDLTALLTAFRHEFPAVRTVAVADRSVEPLRWQILGAGIVWLCTSPRRLEPIVEIIKRHFAGVPKPSRTPEQRIWDELPWPM